MSRRPKPAPRTLAKLAKCPTGIHGLDIITGGGLPRGRPTLVCGGAGSGKTLIAMEFLIRGIQQYGEPGAFMSFEERTSELAENVASLGYDLTTLIADKKLIIDQVAIDRAEIMESGDYDLDGLLIRIAAAIEAVGAKRVVLDTIETLFGALINKRLVRSELHRLFVWLKGKGVTVIVTGERGDGTLTRQGLEEYVSDCVISLDQRVTDQIATRRLRVVKYRGTAHGTNEYPFMIDEQGFTVLPITAIDMNYPVWQDVISTGVPDLDVMLGGKGYFRGGSLLVSGTAGTGKSSLAASFANATCARGERCIYFAFEESPHQITRNMRSIGLDLAIWTKTGLLHFVAFRPSSFGLEVHLRRMEKLIDEFKPQVVIVDPVSSFTAAGTDIDARAMLMRLIDLLKSRCITALLVSLTAGGHPVEQSEIGISSLIDTWFMLRNMETAGERTRAVSVVKSRGMKHSNQTRELLLSDDGVKLAEIFIGPDGDILTGSRRLAQQTFDRDAVAALKHEIARKEVAMQRMRKGVESKISEIQADLAAQAEDVSSAIEVQEWMAINRAAARAGQAWEREQVGGLNTGLGNGDQ